MSSNVTILHSSDYESPEDRLVGFLKLARSLTNVLVSDIEWDQTVWNVEDVFSQKARNLRTCKLKFTKIKVDGNGFVRTELPFSQSMNDFAKAYLRYWHSAKKVGWAATEYRMVGLAYIEAAFSLYGIDPCPTRLTVSVLNKAIELASCGVGRRTRYQNALSINAVYSFCYQQGFLVVPFSWSHGVPYPIPKTQGFTEEALKWREDVLPSPEAYYALAKIFRQSTQTRDRLLSAVVAICMSIPIRIHEVLQLRLNCEVFATVVSDETGDSVDAYGLRVWPGKGNPPQVKWVPTAMVSVVQEAVARLRDMCAPARAVALWYEQDPSSVYLPEDLAHLRSRDWIDKKEMADLMGYSGNNGCNQYLRAEGKEVITRRNRDTRYHQVEISFKSLERQIISNLPKNFPYFNDDKTQKYSETLIVLFVNALEKVRSANPSMIEQCTFSTVNFWLSGSGGKRCVFDEWGITEKDGSPMRVRSHAFRHWLNTIGQLSGLSEIDIANWSGRRIEQNHHYNHVTSKEIASQMRQALRGGNVIGLSQEATKRAGMRSPVSRGEFAIARIGSAHVTDSGICIHDYSLQPCQTHGDCLNCSENVFIKGDLEHLGRAQRRREVLKRQVAQATLAMEQGVRGAQRWAEKHGADLAQLQRAVDIHADRDIADGTLVKLGRTRDSEIAMAIRDRDLSSDGADRDPKMRQAISKMWRS